MRLGDRGILSGALLSLMASGCSDVCGNTVVARQTSPDSRQDAVMFQRDCGATTGFSTQISIVDAGDLPSGMGDVFRADDGNGAARTSAWGGPWASMKWLAPGRLVVSYAAKSRIFEQDDHVSGVLVSYQVVNP
jgi:hypothetical protein